MQVVCNHELKITNIVANWPGSVHDARMFRQSNLAETFERGNGRLNLNCYNKLLKTNTVVALKCSYTFYQHTALVCLSCYTGDHDGHLVADSGYGLKPYCLTPYAVTMRDYERRCNTSITRTRCLIEQAIGVLKRRFACLHGELKYEPNRCLHVVIAAV